MPFNVKRTNVKSNTDLVFLLCFNRFNVSPLHTDEGHRSARKLCVLTCVNKSLLERHHLVTTVNIYQNQHVELTLNYVLFTICAYIYIHTQRYVYVIV